MTTDDIKQRLHLLQNEINDLLDRLPAHTQVSFGMRFHTTSADVDRHKKLVLTLKDIQPQ